MPFMPGTSKGSGTSGVAAAIPDTNGVPRLAVKVRTQQVPAFTPLQETGLRETNPPPFFFRSEKEACPPA